MSDISREACKEMASRLHRLGEYEVAQLEGYSLWPFADLILALRAALDAAEAEINRKADFIDDLLNKLAQADQDLREATDAPNRHAYKVGIAVGRSQAEARPAPDVAGAARVLLDADDREEIILPLSAYNALRAIVNGGAQ